MVKSAKAAKRVLAGLIRYCEGRLQLVVNRGKSRAAPLKSCELLGYRLNQRAKLAWTEKARHRFKERVRLYYWKQWNARSGGQSGKTARRVQSAWPKEASSHARGAATCWHWERIPPRCTWRGGAGKVIGG